MLKAFGPTLLFVKDPQTSADFYERLGFQVIKKENECVITLGEHSIRFFDEGKVKYDGDSGKEKGAGVFLHIQVEDIDSFYEAIKENGFTPSSEPQDQEWGTREFAMRDPDRYKLVFYEEVK